MQPAATAPLERTMLKMVFWAANGVEKTANNTIIS